MSPTEEVPPQGPSFMRQSDWLAGLAMHGLIAAKFYSPVLGGVTDEERKEALDLLTLYSYEIADAMMRRKKWGKAA